ncbi:MAG: ribosomal L7Ae/L30e/S12e/Gadd45 family protein [Desulfobacterales bacterium]|nr:ribosomal L7Ae/L30e/S12e/Gadd45 family protein [Desulfobacterales bacterium]
MTSNRHAIGIPFALVLVLLLTGLCATAASAQAPESKLPAAVTSSGQSPDGFILKMLCDRIKLKVTYNSLIKADELKDFKSLMVVMGGSAKGLGAAGIDEPGELQRMQSVLARAKEQKTVVFGLHIGGEARRGKLSAPFIEQVAPRCDQLIVTEDGNKDGYFTTLAKEKQIPLTVVKDTQELGALLKKTFGAN